MNKNKIATAEAKGVCIYYTDTKKHHFVYYDVKKQPKKEIKANHLLEETLILNAVQTRHYRIAVYGIQAFTESEIKNLSFKEKSEIEAKCKKAQLVINRLKQRTCSRNISQMLEKLFSNSKFIKDFVKDNDYYSDSLVNPMSFKELGIKKKDIIDVLIDNQCLPENFYSLK